MVGLFHWTAVVVIVVNFADSGCRPFPTNYFLMSSTRMRSLFPLGHSHPVRPGGALLRFLTVTRHTPQAQHRLPRMLKVAVIAGLFGLFSSSIFPHQRDFWHSVFIIRHVRAWDVLVELLVLISIWPCNLLPYNNQDLLVCWHWLRESFVSSYIVLMFIGFFRLQWYKVQTSFPIGMSSPNFLSNMIGVQILSNIVNIQPNILCKCLKMGI